MNVFSIEIQHCDYYVSILIILCKKTIVYTESVLKFKFYKYYNKSLVYTDANA